jgi:hypothetical protein
MSLPSAGKRIWAIGALGAGAAVLAACGGDDEPPADRAGSAVSDAAPRAALQTPWPELEGTVRYAVDTDASEIYWLLGKTGAMAAFAHVHAISAETYEGTVTVDGENPQESRFELVFPVGAFVVDDPELRAKLGEEFEGTPSANDIAGTKTNMLSAGLLNAATFEQVRLTGRPPPPGGDKLPVAIEIVGRTFEFELPGSIAVDEEAVEAEGEFTLSHADLGLTPFTAAGGAIAVADNIRFVYRIRAERVPGEAAGDPP